MKSQDFKKGSFETGGSEKLSHSHEKEVRWDEIIYILITVIVLFFVGRYLYVTFFFINGSGFVNSAKIQVQFPSDVKLLKFYQSEGDKINLEDSLFTYISRDNMDNIGLFGSNVGLEKRQQQREKLEEQIRELRRELRYKQIERNQKEKLINFYQGRVLRIRRELYLDLHNRDKLESSTSNLEELTSQAIALTEQINFIEGQINSLQNRIRQIPKVKEDISRNGISRLAELNFQGLNYNESLYKAPTSGIISGIAREAQEVVSSNSTVMTIYKPDSIFVEAYFTFDNVSDLGIGEEVTIQFPDGTSDTGIIHKFKGTAGRVTGMASNPLEGASSFIKVLIRPPSGDSTAIKNWQQHFGKSVKVSQLAL